VSLQPFSVAPGVAEALGRFTVPESLGFGNVTAPVMFSAEFSDGRWGSGELKPYGPIDLLPGARALQYAELVFEGLKAYCVGVAPWPNLFRPLDNWRRMVRSAERLAMQPVPVELFLQGLDAVAGACAAIVPRCSSQALYLRPFLFGTEAGYQLRNSSSFRFMVIASPVGIYSNEPMRIAIERSDVRAAVGGIGAAKAAANYGAALRASAAAAARGYPMTLWLDAQEHRWVQELSGMNVFAVIGGELHTPALDGAILAGITRDSLLVLARHLGYRVHERRIALDELLAQVRSGGCTELLACGTAAIVSPVAVLADVQGDEYRPQRVDDVACRLRQALLAIQERRAVDPFGWTRDVAPFAGLAGGNAPWHAHIYYAPDQHGRAQELQGRLRRLKDSGQSPVLRFIGELRDGKVGPHPCPQFEIHFTQEQLAAVQDIVRESGLTTLVHPLTYDDLADHTHLGNWVGTPIELDLSCMDPPGINQGFARFGRTDF
jgi:branched-chain amino acid aminotransferase